MPLDKLDDNGIFYIGWSEKKIGRWKICFVIYKSILRGLFIYQGSQFRFGHIFKILKNTVDIVMIDIKDMSNAYSSFICTVQVGGVTQRVLVITDQIYLWSLGDS